MKGIVYEYSQAANPKMVKVPMKTFELDTKRFSKTTVFPFNMQQLFNTTYCCTTPSLLAEVVQMLKNDLLSVERNSFTQIFYVLKGSGSTLFNDGTILWSKGDIIVTNTTKCTHKSYEESQLLMITDEPLLNYMGLSKKVSKFATCIFKKHELYDALAQKGNVHNNRCGILLGIKETENTTKTISHTLWCLFNKIASNSVQKPHRHNSVALDLCIYAQDQKVYTLIGDALDSNGNIVNPQKVYWRTNTLFVTPPGMWHSHHNESDEDAFVLPVQDAGIHTYLQTLDIQFDNSL